MKNPLFPLAAILLLFLAACGGRQTTPRLALVLM